MLEGTLGQYFPVKSEETLDQYLRRTPELQGHLSEKNRSNNFYVYALSLPDVFHFVRNRIMHYFEEKGYRCDKEDSGFEPPSRTLFFTDSDNKLAFALNLSYELSDLKLKTGKAHITVKRKRPKKRGRVI